MKLILSPTKTMGVQAPGQWAANMPEFQQEATRLNRKLASLDPDGLKKLFKTSDALTLKVREMIQKFGDAPSCPAILAFRGEAFKTLSPEAFTKEQIRYAHENLKIFSGLYGVVSPSDRVKPYRLDFNTPLKIDGNSLRMFWKARLIPYFETLLNPGEPLINLASDEFASVLSSKTLKERMLTLQFREDKNGKLKNITVRAKQARGLFAFHIIQSAMKNPADLKTISLDGYTYSKTLSSRLEWFFTR